MKIKDFISFKKECELIVTEPDLTTVLAVLDDMGCGKVGVQLHWLAELAENNSWRVSFMTTSEHWQHIYLEVQKVSQHEVLIPLKDVFGNTTYHEV